MKRARSRSCSSSARLFPSFPSLAHPLISPFPSLSVLSLVLANSSLYPHLSPSLCPPSSRRWSSFALSLNDTSLLLQLSPCASRRFCSLRRLQSCSLSSGLARSTRLTGPSPLLLWLRRLRSTLLCSRGRTKASLLAFSAYTFFASRALSWSLTAVCLLQGCSLSSCLTPASTSTARQQTRPSSPALVVVVATKAFKTFVKPSTRSRTRT